MDFASFSQQKYKTLSLGLTTIGSSSFFLLSLFQNDANVQVTTEKKIIQGKLFF